tara:strand:- start:54 stop:203 length:150 start_codon:yes stop_codon:yes gene_type:complete
MILDVQPSFPVHTVSADLAIGLLVSLQEQATGQNLWYQESLAFGGGSAT